MIIWFFLLSGLFLGWSLGANDAANLFGTAVGTRMVRFHVAALVAGIFVILGAVIGGAGVSESLGVLGSINALAGSFTVALSSALVIVAMNKVGFPVSTTQAIIGGIVGWNCFTGSPTDGEQLIRIVSSWILSPILAALLAIIIYLLLNYWWKKTKIHLLTLDYLMRYGLVIIGAFGAYSLGANNIGNVMGVFVSACPFTGISTPWGFALSGEQLLFLFGGIAIALGIFTHSYQLMKIVGNQLFRLTPLTALVAVLAESLVLFLFSSQSIKQILTILGLPTLPLVPVSSSQAIIGAVIGMSIMKGGKGINFILLRKIALGWALTPMITGLLCFILLFFIQNVFMQPVKNSSPAMGHPVKMQTQKQFFALYNDISRRNIDSINLATLSILKEEK